MSMSNLKNKEYTTRDLVVSLHVGVNQDNQVVCKECIKKAESNEKFISVQVEGGGALTCVECLCCLN
jgi:hypothetical protein